MRVLLLAAETGARRALAQRGDLLSLVCFLFFILLALGGVWRAGIGSHGTVGGYDLTALLWYVMVAESTVVPIPGRAIEQIGDEISGGTIAVAMLRPASVVGVRIAMETGAAFVRQMVCLAGGSLFLLITIGAPHSWAGFALALLSAPAGMLLSITLQHLLGGAAFWVRDARATWLLYQKMVLIFGGVLIPLNLLPAGLASVCTALPFAAVAYMPGLLASGHGNVGALVLQAVWLTAALGGAVLIFALGERRLEVLGG